MVGEVIGAEARALSYLGEGIEMSTIAQSPIWASGVGKSGIAALKFVATLRALDVEAHFIHPVEALHGDVGGIKGGTLVVISASGTTKELVDLVEVARPRVDHLVAVTGGATMTPLRDACDEHHDTLHDAQWDHRYVPTVSFIVQVAILDELAFMIAGDRPPAPHPAGAVGALRCAA